MFDTDKYMSMHYSALCFRLWSHKSEILLCVWGWGDWDIFFLWFLLC